MSTTAFQTKEQVDLEIELPIIICANCNSRFTLIYYTSKLPYRKLPGILIGRTNYCPNCGNEFFSTQPLSKERN
jgi:hydrogenase maturation factor HypF (carbamoyltransferase family)